jgi:3-oxoacyl-[acyl-carrier protein] reductase
LVAATSRTETTDHGYQTHDGSPLVNLGIDGRNAIVCGSSRGLGLACAEALAAEGVNIVLNARHLDALAEAEETINLRYAVKVKAVAADISTVHGRDQLLAACPEADILITNNGGPPPGTFVSLDDDAWLAALAANMVAGLALVRGLVPGMRERRFGRIINITSAMVTTPRPHMSLSSAARAGLTAALKALSFDVAADNVTINNLLPERIDTDRQKFMARRQMEARGISYEQARREQELSIPAKRLGRPEEFGAICAFLCSDLAGYISGNNIHVDGGSYPALI